MHKVEVILRVGRGGWRVRQRGEGEAEGEGGLESEADRALLFSLVFEADFTGP